MSGNERINQFGHTGRINQLTKFRAGYRKIQGRWLNPNQYKAYQREQERLSAEAKAAEEKRKAEIKAAQEKQEREELERQQRLARADAERANAVRLAKERLDGKKAAIINEATRLYAQMENAKIKADQLEIACVERLGNSQAPSHRPGLHRNEGGRKLQVWRGHGFSLFQASD